VNLPARRGPSFSDWIRGSIVGWSEEEEFEHVPLMAQRQKMGIWPTLSFWTRRITWKVQLPAIGVALVSTAALAATGMGALAGLVGAASGLLTLGLTERRVRQAWLARGLPSPKPED
jgi:hypothetical protein